MDVPHVWEDRCVCMACYCAAKAESTRAEVGRMLAARPPSEEQLRYARSIGLDFSPDISCADLTELVRAYLTRPAPPELRHEAAVMGVPDAETVPWRALRAQLDHRRLLDTWVFSVCRHMLRADWRTFSDSRLPNNVIVPLVASLAARDGLVDAVRRHAATQ